MGRESVACPSLHVDLLRLLLLILGVGDVHCENPVLAFAADRIRIDILGEREAALEATLEALDAVVLFELRARGIRTLSLQYNFSLA